MPRPRCLRHRLPSGSTPAAQRAVGSVPHAAQSPVRPGTPRPLAAQSARCLFIYASGAGVCLDLLPRSCQDVLAVYLVVQRVEPPRRTRLRGPIQGSLKFSRFVKGGSSTSGTHQRLPPANPQTKYGSFPPRALPRFIGSTSRSDSRSALTHFTVQRLIGLGAPSPPVRWHPTGLTAGAETGLSCSHDGCANVPLPLRRWVLRGCLSKVFTPSMAFAWIHEARLPVGSLRSPNSRRGRLCFMLRTAGLHPPSRRARPRASTPRSPRTPAGCYKGALVPPLAGLTPASHRELPGCAEPDFGP
jgi:hypothetical protein